MVYSFKDNLLAAKLSSPIDTCYVLWIHGNVLNSYNNLGYYTQRNRSIEKLRNCFRIVKFILCYRAGSEPKLSGSRDFSLCQISNLGTSRYGQDGPEQWNMFPQNSMHLCLVIKFEIDYWGRKEVVTFGLEKLCSDTFSIQSCGFLGVTFNSFSLKLFKFWQESFSWL